MNHIVKLIVIISMLCLPLIATVPLIALDIPPEPGQEQVLLRYMKPQLRAFIIVYDLNSDGIGDYMTQRQIGQNYATISEYPLFYGIDLDGDGQLDKETEVVVDPNMDGLDGNEIGLAEWEEMQKNVES